MFDPLYDKIVCVHDEPGMRCDECEHITWNDGYGISEREFELSISKLHKRDKKIEELLGEDKTS